MKTVQEVARLTGVSARTLHYYDEIGLLRPAAKSEAGYRLYDQRSLETLQQILFFREFDIPLKEIRSILASPDFDRDEILRTQKRMLEAKRARLQRLIASIDEILKGDNKMDFAVFTRAELEELSQVSLANLPDQSRAAIVQEFGSEAAWRKHYVERCGRADMQQGYRRMVSWYGSKEAAKAYMMNPPGEEAVRASGERLDAVTRALARRKAEGQPPDAPAVRALIGQYGGIVRRLYRVRDESGLMLSIAEAWYDHPKVVEANEERYGKGIMDYFVKAVKSYYKSRPS